MRESARRADCLSHFRQIGIAVHQYYDANKGKFFLHHPFDADVISQVGLSESFAEIYWEDKLMPFIGGARRPTSSLPNRASGLPARPSIAVPTIFRCGAYVDPTTGQIEGIVNRTSYLMNSQLSHKTRRYGQWTLDRFIREVGTSNFLAFSERDVDGLTAASGADPRQDDYDIWLGTNIFQPWIAWRRHSDLANYLYLDGHAKTLEWQRRRHRHVPRQKRLHRRHELSVISSLIPPKATPPQAKAAINRRAPKSYSAVANRSRAKRAAMSHFSAAALKSTFMARMVFGVATSQRHVNLFRERYLALGPLANLTSTSGVKR